MTAILAIETATEACSAALYFNGAITARYVVAPQQHANLLLPMCDELLREVNLVPAQLSAIAFGRGPGSFTGVRIAVSAAQGIALAHQLPVIPVSSLQALAQATYIKHKVQQVLAGIDARMQEVYWGCYQLHDEIMVLVSKEVVSKIEALDIPESKNWFGAGSAWSSYSEKLKQKFINIIHDTDADIFPNAEALLPIAVQLYNEGKIINAEQALPIYLRDNVVTIPNK